MTVIESSNKFLDRMKKNTGNDFGVILGEGITLKRRDFRKIRTGHLWGSPEGVARSVSRMIVKDPVLAVETQGNVQLSTVITALN
ncbi:MAG: hypothetical protein CBC09_05110 [Cellvibrionales bacterium TMED49]|nr:hypothetical protein [Porticoccaceae bacterium]OUU38658.1 MAG: hypothetical protein CBC09_05110 [Cellvibrionales bacterium TMED49]